MRFASPWWRKSLAARLVRAYLVALLLTVVVVASLTRMIAGRFADVLTGTYLMNRHPAVELRFDAAGHPNSVYPDWLFRALPEDLKYRVLNESGTVVLSSEAASQPLVPNAKGSDGTRVDFSMTDNGQGFSGLIVPVTRNGATYYVQMAVSDRVAEFSRSRLSRLLIADNLEVTLVSILLFGVAMYYTSRGILRPLREASSAAAGINPRSLSARIDTRNLFTEIAPLAEAFNLALDRIEKGFRNQQEFVAGAAHELKTPLALLRAQIETDSGADRRSLLPDLDLISRQVHQLLQLAEVSEDRNYSMEPTDAVEISHDVVRFLARLAERRKVQIEVCDSRDGGAGRELRADRGALFTLLKNLAENAVQHSPQNGVVLVTVLDTEIAVRDEGSGIPAEDLPKVFSRFWRGSARRDEGAGLGLAICQEIVLAHGWRLSVRNTARGAEFTVVIREREA
jgi:signal transduction histidine kinase